ncbi:MAG TPA: hypothetical protein VNT60_06525 [Deinococcales bacterium]|nr:hypothetical protein [Deinococcales bacterium]
MSPRTRRWLLTALGVVGLYTLWALWAISATGLQPSGLPAVLWFPGTVLYLMLMSAPYAIGLLLVFWVIRLAVAHGMKDARARRSP